MLKYNKKELKTYRTTVLQVQPSMRLSVAKHPGADTGKKLTFPKFPRFPIYPMFSQLFTTFPRFFTNKVFQGSQVQTLRQSEFAPVSIYFKSTTSRKSPIKK